MFNLVNDSFCAGDKDAKARYGTDPNHTQLVRKVSGKMVCGLRV